MRRIFLGVLAMGVLASLVVVAGSAHAQTTVTSEQLIGTQTRASLDGALDALQGTLGVLSVRLNNGLQPANPQGVANSLAAIQSTLGGLRSTLAAFDNRARTLAQASTPGLPNTGGGAAAR